MILALKALWKFLWDFARSVPWWAWAFLVAVVAFYLYGEHTADQRETEVRQEYRDRDLAESVKTAQLETKQTEVTTKVITEYVDRVRVIREKGETITKLVPVYVPLLELPGSWRVLHDAAATGQVPDPARTADAPGTDTQVLAATVSDNYATCHANAEQLTKLQDWVLEQSKLWQTSANSSGG